MSIGYDVINKRIVVSGETACTFNSIYNESLRQGWDVVQNLDDTYVFSAKLYLTNGSILNDQGKIVIFDGGALPNNEVNEIWISVASGCTIILGTANNTSYTGSNGCVIYFKNSPSVGYRSNWENYGEVYLYGCTIKSGINNTNGILLWRGGKWVFWGCYFDGSTFVSLEEMTNSGNEFKNCIFYKITSWGSTTTFLDSTIVVSDFIDPGANNLVYRNCKIYNTGLIWFRSNSNPKTYIFDSTATNWDYYIINASANNEIYRGYTIGVTVLDSYGQPIPNATVQLYDKNNTLLFNLYTNISGIISPQDVIENSWIAQGLPSNNYVETINYNPFTLVITAAGYEPYMSKFNLTEKYRGIVTLVAVPVDKTNIILDTPQNSTNNLTNPLINPPSIGDNPFSGEEGMNTEQLINAIDETYKSTMVTIRTFSTGGANNQEIIITDTTKSLSEAISNNEVSDDLRKALSDAIAQKVVEHIQTQAETEGSTNEIINLKENVATLNNNLMNFYSTLSNWTPVPMDGGSALKVLLASVLPTYTQQLVENLQDMETSFVYELMDKNIK